MEEVDLNRPPQGAPADITLITRGLTVSAYVEVSTDAGIVMSPRRDAMAQKIPVSPGDKVEIFWVGSTGELTLPAQVVEVDDGAVPGWHLLATGPTQRSQRRKVVRARIELPVVLPWAGGTMTGTTVDLSEGGMRALLDGWGLPPESDTRLEATITVDEGVFVDVHGAVIWTAERAAQWLLAMRFDDVPDRDADLLRRRVFKALREERAAAAR